MINYRLLFTVFVLIACCAALGKARLAIDTDVAGSLPRHERFIADALDIFHHHPIHDQVAVDVSIDRNDQDALVERGIFLEQKMQASTLFTQIGTEAMGELLPRLAVHVARNLPLLFSEPDLQKIAPLLAKERIRERVGKLHNELAGLEGVGQTPFMGIDPLGLKDTILARMALLAPSLNARFHKGHLLSGDGRHMLVTARPLAAGTNTASARALADFFEQTDQEMRQRYGASGIQTTITPVGAYRAALDNETMIRHDVQLALILSTAGIAFLLFLSFSSPLIGLLALLPSLAGTAASLLIYSLLRSSISIMVLGFGGALISITVDYGIAYLLFLDRPQETKGKEAAHEVKAVGIMALATTLVAFLTLFFSDFPVFVELGLFAGIGVLFSFLFVHTVFPRIFPVMPAGKESEPPLMRMVNILYSGGLPGFVAGVLLVAVLILFARPQVLVNMDSMNTVSQATQDADSLFTRVWGKLGDRVFVMNSGDTIMAVQQGNDASLARIQEDIRAEFLNAAFVPSMIFPGQNQAAENLAAWHAFWDRNRIERVTTALSQAGIELGFTEDAFTPFFSTLAPEFSAVAQEIPREYYGLLGISENTTGKGQPLIQFITVTPGKNYDATAFLARYGTESKIYDSVFFGKKLAELLFSTFFFILMSITICVFLLLFLANLNLPLTLLTLLPSLFAYICTLGTMKLIGQPLDIPALMLLSIAILGLGIDYAIFLVRGHQRYRVISHPSYVRVRASVFLSATSTMIGFGVLCFAEHSLLRSIGISSLLGILYSLLGSFLLLPLLLNRYFSEGKQDDSLASLDLATRVRRRYRTLEPYPRLFTRFKLRLDPLFVDLPLMLAAREEIKIIVDIGCGYGVPACWCVETYKEALVFAIEPDAERVRVASLALGDRGVVTRGFAPDMPPVPGGEADVVLLLDMLHYVDEATVATLFSRSFQILADGGIVALRCSILPAGQPSWAWRWEERRNRVTKQKVWFRSPEMLAELLKEAGFIIVVKEIGLNPELVWLVAMAQKEAPGASPLA